MSQGTIERCPHPHAWPAVECIGVRLTRARRALVCMCGHPKAVHEHWRKGLDCGLCDCLHYEGRRDAAAVVFLKVGLAAYAVGMLALLVFLFVGYGIPLLQAIARS